MFTKILFASYLFVAATALPNYLHTSGGNYYPEPHKQTYGNPSPPKEVILSSRGYNVPEPPQNTYITPGVTPPKLELYSSGGYNVPESTKKPDGTPTVAPLEEQGWPFKYDYKVKDNNGNDFSHKTDSDGRLTTGEYRILLADGRTQVVKYVSNGDEGFVADVTYEGTAKIEETKPGGNLKPQSTYQPSQQSYQPSKQTYQPPKQTYEPPKQTTQPPKQTYQPPNLTYQPPNQTYEPPKQTTQPPKQTYQRPQEASKPPPQFYFPAPGGAY